MTTELTYFTDIEKHGINQHENEPSHFIGVIEEAMFSASSLITATRTAFWDGIRIHFCSQPLLVFFVTPRMLIV